MNDILLGIILGLAFGVVDVLIMIPLKYENQKKRLEAMAGAFIERFMIGFLVPNLNFAIHPAVTGLLIGLGLSLPSAIITRAYAPIIGTGILGGVLVGLATMAL